jgi:hypothetical protein
MRVKFEYSEDDLVDVYRRSLKRSPTIGSARSKDRVWFSIIAAGLGFLLLAAAKGQMVGLIVGALSGLIALLLHPVIYRRATEKRLRKLAREQHDSTEPRICEVELTPAGLWSRQGKTQVIHEWGGVESIDVTDDGVEIKSKGCSMMVRNRAFQSDADRQQFLELANSYHRSAGVEGKT